MIFAGVVDEEGNATGVKQLVKSKLGVDYAMFGEPSGVENITVAYKGRLAIQAYVRRRRQRARKRSMACEELDGRDV